MNVVMELRSVAAILQMVATTGSLAFVSELGVRPRDRRVTPIAVRGLRIVRKLGIVQKRNRPLSPAAAAFVGSLGGG
jgi:DNA-binding transcriptional LysR family regulator